jgi:molybdopterin molybdotransferase
LAGHRGLFRRAVTARVTERIVLGPRLQHFLRGIVREVEGEREARLTGPQGSGILTSMARANALLIVPEGQASVEAGETLQALLLDETVHLEKPPY